MKSKFKTAAVYGVGLGSIRFIRLLSSDLEREMIYLSSHKTAEFARNKKSVGNHN